MGTYRLLSARGDCLAIYGYTLCKKYIRDRTLSVGQNIVLTTYNLWKKNLNLKSPTFDLVCCSRKNSSGYLDDGFAALKQSIKKLQKIGVMDRSSMGTISTALRKSDYKVYVLFSNNKSLKFNNSH